MIVGLTGGIGSGKSAAANFFQNEGIAIEPLTIRLHISVYGNFCKQTIQKNPKSVCSLCCYIVYFNASTKYILIAPENKYRNITSLYQSTTFCNFKTKTFEINLVSNEPLFGALDWTVGAFYMQHDIENHIRGYRDNNNDGQISYECSSPLAVATSCYEHDYGIPGRFAVFDAEWDFVTDAFPSRESYSIYAQTTYSFSDDVRLVSGLRYSEDTFETDVTNFFNVESFTAEGTSDKVTGKIVGEYDVSAFLELLSTAIVSAPSVCSVKHMLLMHRTPPTCIYP